MLYYDNDTKRMRMIVKDTGSFVISIKNYVLDDGDEVIFTINSGKEIATPLLQKIITTFQNGKAVISLSSADTNIEPGNYLYDVQLNTADGRVDTILGPAKFKFEGGITY